MLDDDLHDRLIGLQAPFIEKARDIEVPVDRAPDQLNGYNDREKRAGDESHGAALRQIVPEINRARANQSAKRNYDPAREFVVIASAIRQIESPARLAIVSTHA